MRDYIDALVFPKFVVIAVRHRLSDPFLVIRSELQVGGSWAQRQTFRIFANLFSEMQERPLCGRIASRIASLRSANVEDPVQPAHLEGAVMAHAVNAIVRHGICRNHRRQIRRIRERKRVLRASWI